jgi:hypothetical protein
VDLHRHGRGCCFYDGEVADAEVEGGESRFEAAVAVVAMMRCCGVDVSALLTRADSLDHELDYERLTGTDPFAGMPRIANLPMGVSTPMLTRAFMSSIMALPPKMRA